jgi:ATP-dependent Clp protease ATP-binding subunit ClpA
VESGKKVDKQKLLDVLIEKGTFKPEFINRFDAVVIFNPLTKENLLQIAQLSLQALQKNLKEKEIDFEITEPLKEKIVELSYKPEFGAREMRRVIQDNVENVVAEALISEKIKKGDTIQVDPENFELLVNAIDKTS